MGVSDSVAGRAASPSPRVAQAATARRPEWPDSAEERDRFVLSRRPPRQVPDPWRHQGVLVEDERAADGSLVRAATVFLTGRECPWRCVMCDLWTRTVEEDTPAGALVQQLRDARGELGPWPPEHVKLYNAGSFFDPRAVPEADYAAIAENLRGFRHVIVESHPRLIGRRLGRWQDALRGAAGTAESASLEVAIGLETAHPTALERLHKRFTLDDFRRAADRLRDAGAALRVFLLVGVPFLSRAEQLEWLRQSVAFAFDCGASVVSLIPTRPGNGALDAMGSSGLFDSPSLDDLERALDAALPAARGRVFADLWDVERIASCPACLDARRERMRRMNLTQRLEPRLRCVECDGCDTHPVRERH